MPATATIISRSELTVNMMKFVYNLTSVAASSEGSEYGMSINPFTLCSLQNFYIVNASTFTVSLSDVSGGTNTPTVDEILRVEDVNRYYNENDLGILVNSSDSYLYIKIKNQDTALATGISTISFVVRR